MCGKRATRTVPLLNIDSKSFRLAERTDDSVDGAVYYQ